MRKNIKCLHVHAISARATVGTLIAGWIRVPCALGRSGLSHRKTEGDGTTPVGHFTVESLLYRPDRALRPRSGLPAHPIKVGSGWCDRPGDRNYNRLVQRPYPASHEAMDRGDDLYDMVLVIDYNHRRRIQGRGSAVFLHLARDNLEPTAGCVAIPRRYLPRLLALCGPHTRLVIWAPAGPPPGGGRKWLSRYEHG
ncbi:MAG: L,D-transpeptidase family protein [Rhizobiales bacterium]|nr:L,D-transpeptidase family protein [Hyphomicrobiales bacterium]